MKPSFDDIAAWLGAKPAGHFTIERWGRGLAVTIHRAGQPAETILAETAAEANRLRLQLSDEGLTGYIAGGAL